MTVQVRGIDIVEERIYGKGRWFGKLAGQTATLWCTPLDTGLSLLYRAVSGAGVYGADGGDEAQIFGADDVIAGALTINIRELLVVANTSGTLYLNRIIWGTGTMAAAITADQYVEFPYCRAIANTVRVETPVSCPAIPIGTQVWLQTMNASDDAVIDFVINVYIYNV